MTMSCIICLISICNGIYSIYFFYLSLFIYQRVQVIYFMYFAGVRAILQGSFAKRRLPRLPVRIQYHITHVNWVCQQNIFVESCIIFCPHFTRASKILKLLLYIKPFVYNSSKRKSCRLLPHETSYFLYIYLFVV